MIKSPFCVTKVLSSLLLKMTLMCDSVYSAPSVARMRSFVGSHFNYIA